jgi:hypothetical protein
MALTSDDKSIDCVLKKKKEWRTGRMAQVVKNLPNNCEALSLNPSTTKKKKKSLN